MVKITISGLPGSGKTTLSKTLAEKLHLFFVPNSFARDLAEEKKVTINKLMEMAKKDSSIHKEIDKKIIKWGKEKNNFVLVGWIAYHFIPDSIKIFLYVSPEEGAKRIYKNQRKDEPNYFSIKETQEKTKKRIFDTKEGFEKAYNLNFLLRKNYDIVVDTTKKSQKKVLKEILKKIKKYKQI